MSAVQPVFVGIPKFILEALNDCVSAGVVPYVREGRGGNTHSTWFIRFNVRVDKSGSMSEYHAFEVKVTSSYNQKFLSFTLFKGRGFDGLMEMRCMADCAARAKSNVGLMTEAK